MDTVLTATGLVVVILFLLGYQHREKLLLAILRKMAEPKSISLNKTTVRHPDIPYSNDQKLDLYLPSEQHSRLPVVICLFGGGWFVGNKLQPAVTMKAHRLTEFGYAVLIPDYRLSSEAKFPAQLDDVSSAIHWVRENADNYQLDAERIAVWGCSAGGHLAALSASLENYSENSSYKLCRGAPQAIQAAISFFGPAELNHWYKNHPKRGFASPYWMIKELLDLEPEQHSVELTAASPLSYISSESAPILLVQGGKDTVVPPEQSELIKDAYMDAGAEVDFQFHPEAGHGTGRYFGSDQMLEDLDQFLSQYLKAKPN